jgi:excisionase family DNA binding protein
MKRVTKTDANRRRQRAYSKVQWALRTGRLIRQPCGRCGSKRSEAHHEDYDKPLDVTWLCRSCHRGRHWRVNGVVKPTSKLLMSPAEVGRVVGVRPRTVARWCRNGEIEAMKVGRVWRVHRNTVRRLVKKGK